MQKQIQKLFLSNFLGGLSFYLPIFTLFLLNKGITLPEIIFAQVIYSIASFFAEVPTGVLADRVGHHKSVSLGYFTDILAFLLIMFYPTATTLMVAFAIRGIAGAFTSGSKEALLYEYCQRTNRNYKKDYSHLTSYEILGIALSTFIAGIVIQQFGQASYIPIFIATILAIFLAGSITFTLTSVKIKLDTGKELLHEIKHCFKLFKTSHILVALFLAAGLTYEGNFILMQLYPPHMINTHVAPFFLGASLSVASAFNYFFVRHAYLIEKPLGAKRAIVCITIFIGILYVLFGLATNPYLVISAFIILYGFCGTVSVFISDYANKHTPSHIRATVLSSINFSREVFKTGYKLLVGTALGLISLANVFAFFGLMLILGASISYLFINRAEKHT